MIVYRVLPEARFDYLAFGALFLGRWIWRECRLSQSYHLAFGVLLLALAAPGRSSAFLFPALASTGRALLLCGTALILAGLLDHLQLVRILGPSAAVSHEEMQAAEPLEAER